MDTKKKYILIAERSREDVALKLGFAAKKIYNKKRYIPLVIYDHKPTLDCYKIYNVFNIFEIYHYTKIIGFLNYLKLFFCSIIHFIYSFFIIWIKGLDWFVYHFKVKNVLIGDLIYDRYIRTENKYLSPKLIDLKFLKLLFFGIFKVFSINKVFDLFDIKLSLVGSKSYISMSAIILRVSLQRNKKSIFIGGFGYKIYHKKYNFVEPLRDAVVTFQKKINKNILKIKSTQYFNDKINGKLNSNKRKGMVLDDEKHWTVFKTYPKFNNVLLQKEKKYSKTIIFASHCFSEVNHYTGNIVFRDYFQQFIETIKFAKKDKNHLWVFKIHPKSNTKYKEFHSTMKILKDNSSDNILVPPIDYSNKILFKYADLIVSTRGTICLEAATYGINNIMTTENFFTGFGFTNVKKNKKSYFESFNKIESFKKLPFKSMNTAKEILYLSKTIYRDNPYNILSLREFLSKLEFKKELSKLSRGQNFKKNKLYDVMIEQFL
jgi:hypothetical protein|tara:strand:+ start:176 stop:1642 length:1467 start_codon:yes stop_codon:yes gene_type:complete